MTDERNNSKINNNNRISNSNSNVVSTTSSSNNHSNNSSERIIAEAAKILLKNGLNGTNAAAAATLLTAAAAATFQLPAPPPLFVSASSTATTTTTAAATNGLLPFVTISTNSRTTSSPTPRAMTTAAASSPVAAAPKADLGVLDYTLGGVGSVGVTASIGKNADSLQKTSTANHYETSRQPLSTASSNSNLGGRLQFFKDGKFILELARSKDGEKGGWVSVPRKTFRAPSAATSATVTPTSAAVAHATYPKNENSTSLSFSDDNSSIQSSPWQRDHSWKQSRPRRGISKEMTLFYQRPKSLVLTKRGLKAAAKKRRKPYENTKTASELFEYVEHNLNKTCTEVNVSVKAETGIDGKAHEVSLKSETKPKSNELASSDLIKDESLQSNLNKAAGSDCKDVLSEKASKETVIKDETVEVNCETNSTDDNVTNKEVGKVTTSSEGDDGEPMLTDDTEELHLKKSPRATLNGTMDEVKLETKNKSAMAAINNENNCTKSNGSPEIHAPIVIKQNKKGTRAKLTTIIQKLIDSVPARLEQLSKLTTVANTVAGNGSGSGSGVINSLSHTLTHKVSPPTSAATRLVESYHQQHVSPRKRILREFEKVSLEDNNVNNGAGGKRSRAKGGFTPKSSPSRCSASPMSLANTTATVAGSNIPTVTPKPTSTTPTSTPTTRLNSSYSIHSLLGGSNSSTSKKSNDQPATIISNVLQQQQQQQISAAQLYTSSAYTRSNLTSPKSPDASSTGGGKSPSTHASLNKKRSPPYAASSPMHETHSHSPTVSHDYGRRTPPDSGAYKMQLIQQSSQQQQQHHHHHQTFYPPPYIMTPQYVPPHGLAHSPTVAANASRMPTSALSSNMSPHIPPHSSASRDLSPPRASTVSPRESATTPRTVPKKTASIRREFASPTASNSSTATSCPSPGDRSIASPERKPNTTHHPTSNATGSPLHYYLYPPPSNGATSPHAGTVTTPTVQPPPPPILGTPPATSSSAAAVAAAAAAAAAAYIPSVVTPTLYHPYISTLAALRHNPLWLHHYQAGPTPLMAPSHPHAAATPSVSASHRLSPPFHPFAYNGVVAAAAAAAAFGQHPSPVPSSATHLLHSAVPPPHSASSAALQSLQLHPPIASAISASAEHKNHMPSKLTDTSSGSSGSPALARTYTTSVAAPATNPSVAGLAGHYHSSLRDELSSDIPLNLSKH